VARRTREAVRLCEGAGFDVVLIETVGVGQSETAVAQMSDLFVLLLAPAGGDELQGVKRGIMEMADLILINKADGDLKSAATRTCADYAGALRLMRKRPQDPDGFPRALMVSALHDDGLEAAWQDMLALVDWRRGAGVFDQTRRQQAQHWFMADLRDALLAQLDAPEIKDDIARLSEQVGTGQVAPGKAAEMILANLGGKVGQAS
jgi:LAO/AO transport system kinase